MSEWKSDQAQANFVGARSMWHNARKQVFEGNYANAAEGLACRCGFCREFYRSDRELQDCGECPLVLPSKPYDEFEYVCNNSCIVGDEESRKTVLYTLIHDGLASLKRGYPTPSKSKMIDLLDIMIYEVELRQSAFMK